MLFIYSLRFISVGTVAFSHQFFYRFHFQWRNWIHFKVWQKRKYMIEIEFAICVRKCSSQYYYSFSTLLTFASFQTFPSVVQEIQFHHLLNFIYTMPCRSVKHKTIKHMNMHWILLFYMIKVYIILKSDYVKMSKSSLNYKWTLNKLKHSFSHSEPKQSNEGTHLQ